MSDSIREVARLDQELAEHARALAAVTDAFEDATRRHAKVTGYYKELVASFAKLSDRYTVLADGLVRLASERDAAKRALGEARAYMVRSQRECLACSGEDKPCIACLVFAEVLGLMDGAEKDRSVADRRLRDRARAAAAAPGDVEAEAQLLRERVRDQIRDAIRSELIDWALGGGA